ncbi:glutathione S-transferase C-terminal domain-containing protein homolog [Bombyx mori]|uniref:Methyltransferase domain-containing protein n=1 Tax=Bombyx mori TaxID=7091 RepID=A0A8R2C687_BOMMO|nr:glutathione S-transferase C-terminal domain-containing protein homolog [Bombyx mori]
MTNAIYLEVNTSKEDYQSSKIMKLPLESLIIYCIYVHCNPEDMILNFVYTSTKLSQESVALQDENLIVINEKDVPWQIMCTYPVVMFNDTILAGLCAVARHICKFITRPHSLYEHEEGLLGFRKSCLQAPNEASIWTKFCEVDIIRTVKEMFSTASLDKVPKNLVRFENHLRKPVRMHNVYKIAREINKGVLKVSEADAEKTPVKEEDKNDKNRVPKSRKWKSNTKKDIDIDCTTKIKDLNISHQYAEGPFVTLADLVLFPSYHIIVQFFGGSFESLFPYSYKWYKNLLNTLELKSLVDKISKLEIKNTIMECNAIPETEDVSLYKCDPKRHNPKKRLFTKEDDIIKALSLLQNDMELNVDDNKLDCNINWADVPDGANPTAGHLPDERVLRKSQQLENLALAVLSVAQDGDIIVDFCSGSGHLGILVAHLLPNCTIILLENKEQSLLRARKRVHEMGMKNVLFFQCNLDFFVGNFDIGIALHACGIASDLVLDKCLHAKAKFVLCPCCYGSLHATDRLAYPRSYKFSNLPINQYLCIGHAADQTHNDHPLTVRGAKCMAIIDSDRGHLAQEFGYTVTLTRLKPLSCTPKNNLLIGVPS